MRAFLVSLCAAETSNCRSSTPAIERFRDVDNLELHEEQRWCGSLPEARQEPGAVQCDRPLRTGPGRSCQNRDAEKAIRSSPARPMKPSAAICDGEAS